MDTELVQQLKAKIKALEDKSASQASEIKALKVKDAAHEKESATYRKLLAKQTGLPVEWRDTDSATEPVAQSVAACATCAVRADLMKVLEESLALRKDTIAHCESEITMHKSRFAVCKSMIEILESKAARLQSRHESEIAIHKSRFADCKSIIAILESQVTDLQSELQSTREEFLLTSLQTPSFTLNNVTSESQSLGRRHSVSF
jgi:hypothetical protein